MNRRVHWHIRRFLMSPVGQMNNVTWRCHAKVRRVLRRHIALHKRIAMLNPIVLCRRHGGCINRIIHVAIQLNRCQRLTRDIIHNRRRCCCRIWRVPNRAIRVWHGQRCVTDEVRLIRCVTHLRWHIRNFWEGRQLLRFIISRTHGRPSWFLIITTILGTVSCRDFSTRHQINIIVTGHNCCLHQVRVNNNATLCPVMRRCRKRRITGCR